MTVTKDEKQSALVEGSGDEWSCSIRDYKDFKPVFQHALDGDLDQRLWAQQKSGITQRDIEWKRSGTQKKDLDALFCLILCVFFKSNYFNPVR